MKKLEEEAMLKAFLSLPGMTGQWFLSVAEGFSHSFMPLFRNFSIDCIGKNRLRLLFSYSMRIEANVGKIKLSISSLVFQVTWRT